MHGVAIIIIESHRGINGLQLRRKLEPSKEYILSVRIGMNALCSWVMIHTVWLAILISKYQNMLYILVDRFKLGSDFPRQNPTYADVRL